MRLLFVLLQSMRVTDLCCLGKAKGAREMAEFIMCFPQGCENLSSIHQTHVQKLDVEAHTCDPSPGETDRQLPRVQCPASLA